MLIAMSDLHFTDGTSGDHNLPAGVFIKALTLLNIDKDKPDETVKSLKKKGIKELKIVFLGDIFDPVRSQLWFKKLTGLSENIRPWGTSNDKTDWQAEDVKKKYRTILAQMVEPSVLQKAGLNYPAVKDIDKNRVRKVWETCEFFRELKNDLSSSGLNVKLHYIPGNHDCAMHTDRELRKIAVAALDLDDSDSKFDTIYADPEYCVIGFHGHEIDRMNMGCGNLDKRDYDDQLYKEPSIGTAITLEIACRLAWETARKLKQKKYQQMEDAKRIIEIVENLDNVRPAFAIFAWLDFVAVSIKKDEIREIMDKVVEKVFDDFARIKFVEKCSKEIDQRYIPEDAPAVKRFLANLVDMDFHEYVRKIDNTKAAAELMKGAFSSGKTEYERTIEIMNHKFRKQVLEPAFGKFADQNHRYYLYGHTHLPEVVPISGQVYPIRKWWREEVMINTGTFRPRVLACGDRFGNQGFTEQKNMSFAVIYKKGEKEEKEIGRNEKYEFWNGLLKDARR